MKFKWTGKLNLITSGNDMDGDIEDVFIPVEVVTSNDNSPNDHDIYTRSHTGIQMFGILTDMKRKDKT